MANQSSKTAKPHVDPSLIEWLKRVFSDPIEMKDTDREVGFKLGVQEVINKLTSISENP